jgi:hypothetical protein
MGPATGILRVGSPGGAAGRRRAKPARVPGLAPGLAVGLLALALAGCAKAPPAARIALPGELSALAGTEPLVLQMPVGAAQGEFRLGEVQGRFQRHASRLDLAGHFAQDRAGVSFTLQPGGRQAECRLVGHTLSAGIVHLPLKRPDLHCRFSQHGQPLTQRLELQALPTAAGTRTERRGRLVIEAGQRAAPDGAAAVVAEGLTLELQSLHQLQGGRWPTPAPAGYVIRHQGVAVAALDLNDTRPRLWLRPAPEPLAGAIVDAALALALLWDPVAD